MINRKEEIKKKGFSMAPLNQEDTYIPLDFSKIKVGMKTLEDAVYNLGSLKKANSSLGSKDTVLEAINRGDIKKMREISNFFFKTSGIYSRLCRYFANLYKYDWYVTTYYPNKKKVTEKDKNKSEEMFYDLLTFLDLFDPKKFFTEVSLKIIKNGCYYGYKLIFPGKKVAIQELPLEYCRSRFTVGGEPAVEFKMSYFDDAFTDKDQRERVLKMFPPEFKKGYRAYKAGKLVPDFPGDEQGWYLLDSDLAFKFNINGEDIPFFINVCPAICDLDEAQELDKKKMAQKLLKIIIQKMPLDKNGDLIFDVEEAQELHNNAVRMLEKAIGVDVLTTFADVEVADMESSHSTVADESMDRVKSAVYDQAGVSQLAFNSDGNIALNNSITNDEASLYNVLLQFKSFLNSLISNFNTNKKFYFKVEILSTTWYNYKELSKMYKEQVTLGYGRMLTQIALGISQSMILATGYFENTVLSLNDIFIPPLSSNTMNTGNLNNKNLGEEKKAGRKEKEDNEKSDKTLKNLESES